MTKPLKAPFPYFGGKSKIATDAWKALGNVNNYIEPFAGSLAVLLARPKGWRGSETVNDLDCLLVNAWRAIQASPVEVSRHVIGCVSEVDLEARHHHLVSIKDSIRDQLGDPEWSNPKIAAWWIKGACEWIGDGWCSGRGPWSWTADDGWARANGRVKRQLPSLGNCGTGINRKLPHLGGHGKGINRQIPSLGDHGKGVNTIRGAGIGIGIGIGAGAYMDRVGAVTNYLSALRDRLCSVRIACGSWARILGTSVTTHQGLTGIFLDPPYDGTEDVYSESAPVSAQVREWCAANGDNPMMRIVLAGRADEHDDLLSPGWSKHVWGGARGYSKTTDRKGEALWLSPNCQSIRCEKQEDLAI